jgi:hypothetical protein
LWERATLILLLPFRPEGGCDPAAGDINLAGASLKSSNVFEIFSTDLSCGNRGWLSGRGVNSMYNEF